VRWPVERSFVDSNRLTQQVTRHVGLALARRLKRTVIARLDARPDNRPLVFIVDDDGPSANLLARLHHVDGYDAEVTTDGAAAIARLTRSPVPPRVHRLAAALPPVEGV